MPIQNNQTLFRVSCSLVEANNTFKFMVFFINSWGEVCPCVHGFNYTSAKEALEAGAAQASRMTDLEVKHMLTKGARNG